MYYLVKDLPYEGCLIEPYGTLEEVEEAYETSRGDHAKDYLQGIAVIEGKLLKAKGTLKDLSTVRG